MRRGMFPEIILHEDTFIGFDLSADYCSEHEWGISFVEAFGVGKKDDLGINKRCITRLPAPSPPTYRELSFFDVNTRPKISYLVYDTLKKTSDLKENKKYGELYIGASEVGSAWDSRSFGIATTKYAEELKTLHAAFLALDIVLGTFGGGALKNSGFKILIASRVPQDVKDLWLESDEDERNLMKASERTNIHKILEKAGKKYYALSAKWSGDRKGTKYPVHYWLNPMDQDNNNFGWWTVEELLQWSKGIGPIVKNHGR